MTIRATGRRTLLLVLVTFHCLTNVSAAPPNSWPPRLKNIDIWGDEAGTAAAGRGSQFNGNNDAADEPEVIIGQYGESMNGTATGSRRDGRVLNFFPLPVDDECVADDGTRSGICLNTYECRIQGGTSKGQCALGFGVCCIFTATCGQEVFNNITYIISPSFPSLMAKDIKNCTLKIKMISSEVSQLRLDFVHFSMGQPNRSTGVCDGDQFVLSGGAAGEFMLCGQNHGQHMYYDVPVPSSNNSVAAREDEGDGVIEVLMNFAERFGASRLFEIRVTQIPFSQRAPAGCMQYFTAAEGIIQTFNFAENGRHLADQNYRACVRQETGMCSIQYEPCNDQSFRIGPRRRRIANPFQQGGQNPGSFFNPAMSDTGSIPGLNSPSQGVVNPINGQFQPIQAADAIAADPSTAGVAADEVPAADQEVAASDVVEGSGGGDLPAVPGAPAADVPAIPAAPVPSAAQVDPVPSSSFFSFPSFTSFFTRGFFGGTSRGQRSKQNRRSRQTNHPHSAFDSPYSSRRQSRQSQFFGSECTDRITLPCVVEDFIAAGMGNVPTCLPIHCGNTLCAPGVFPCRIESTVKPFGIGIHFGGVGEEEEKGSPEENIGACLRYNQVRC